MPAVAALVPSDGLLLVLVPVGRVVVGSATTATTTSSTFVEHYTEREEGRGLERKRETGKKWR